MENILRHIHEGHSQVIAELNAAFTVYGASRSEFSDSFSKEIAERSLAGSIDFDIADCAMNALSAWTPLEDFPSYSWAVYQAFDEGEYLHPGQVIGSNEDVYTRPLLHKAMSVFHPLDFS